MTNIAADNNNDLISQVSQGLQTFDVSQLTPAELETIAKMVMVDHAKEHVKNEAHKANLDRAQMLKEYLDTFSNDTTREKYRVHIEYFYNWIDAQGLHFADVKARQADQYTAHLKARELSNNTIRLYIAAIRAFYTALARWEVVDRNYFKNGIRVKKTRKKELLVPSNAEVEQIRAAIAAKTEATGRGSNLIRPTAEKNLLVFNILTATGCRLDFIPSIQVRQNAILTGVSKGKAYTAQVTKVLARAIKKANLSNHKRNSYTKWFTRLCKSLGVPAYSPHSLRHWKAVTEYESTKDIYHVCRLLNHTSVAVTENYLKSLGLKIHK